MALLSTRVWLEYAPRRVECPDCGVRTEAVPWAAHGGHFTLLFEELVAYLAQATDKTQTSRLAGIAWASVGTIVERVVARCGDGERLAGLRRIGIDEFSYRKRHRYITTVVDHDTGRVVWAGEGRSADALAPFFEQLGPEGCAAIEVVTIDFSGAPPRSRRSPTCSRRAGERRAAPPSPRRPPGASGSHEDHRRNRWGRADAYRAASRGTCPWSCASRPPRSRLEATA